MQGARYCRTECLELALLEILGRARPVSGRATSASHRIPLGLLLLSRQQLTAAQLRTALETQRSAGQSASGSGSGSKRKIGVWLQHLGFVTERQVTAALACQWSCPVLWAGPGVLGKSGFSLIPVLLLESFQMMPVELVEASGTLLMAFSEGIDYAVLNAIEQMLGYRTEACVVCPSTLQKSLEEQVHCRESSDVVFDRIESLGECARIVGSYIAKVEAEEVRFARCGKHLWIRLERLRHEAINLVLRIPPGSSHSLALSSQ